MPSALISVVIPVYRDPLRAIAAATALSRLDLPPKTRLEIIIVDDGSNDGSSEVIRSQTEQFATFVGLPRNLGRAAARNAGAQRATGDTLIFMDCDCRPARPDFLQQHLNHLKDGVIASAGPISGDGNGFWHQYQEAASRRRAIQHAQGIWYVGNTGNLMVKRAAFIQVGGFDEAYKAYGFEDRDLLIRLGTLGSIAWARDAVIEHHDTLNLLAVCQKMREAGARTSTLFSARHPDAYVRLGHAALDARQHPGLGWLATCLRPLLSPTVQALQWMIDRNFLPFFIGAPLVRLSSGLAFLLGTSEAKSRQD